MGREGSIRLNWSCYCELQIRKQLLSKRACCWLIWGERLKIQSLIHLQNRESASSVSERKSLLPRRNLLIKKMDSRFLFFNKFSAEESQNQCGLWCSDKIILMANLISTFFRWNSIFYFQERFFVADGDLATKKASSGFNGHTNDKLGNSFHSPASNYCRPDKNLLWLQPKFLLTTDDMQMCSRKSKRAALSPLIILTHALRRPESLLIVASPKARCRKENKFCPQTKCESWLQNQFSVLCARAKTVLWHADEKSR